LDALHVYYIEFSLCLFLYRHCSYGQNSKTLLLYQREDKHKKLALNIKTMVAVDVGY
jgi:hypothetical protein